MTPMTKNITVVDENGIPVGSTYPKRAYGLVKKGRAHWIGKDSVCLCAHNTEEIKMPNNIYDVIDNQFSKLQGQYPGVFSLSVERKGTERSACKRK